MQKVINFSGGRSSALMTIIEYKPGDLVIFTDTGREHPETYKFIDQFEVNEKIPVIRIAYEGGFEALIKKENCVPNRVMRFCTKKMKVILCRKYLASIGHTEYISCIGFRSDEQHRIVKYDPKWVGVKPKFPLNEKGISKQMVNDYWANKSYKLGIPSILGNCDLCFMKGKNAIISILVSHPELAERWIADEESIGQTYLKEISMRQMLNIAQNHLFRNINLEETSPAFDCACSA